MTTSENWFAARRKGKINSNLFRLDIENKTPEENIAKILQGLYVKKQYNLENATVEKNAFTESRLGLRGGQRSSSDSVRLSYLNALVTLCKKDKANLGFTSDELMTCIRVSLVDDSMLIRAAALRVLRHLIKTDSDVATFNTLKLPYLVIRSIDLMLRNEDERAQALRVIRRVVAVVGAAGQFRRYRAAFVEEGLLRCLTAVARSGVGDGTGDRMSRPAVATLAEICVLNPDLFITCGGVNAVIRQLAECATPRMAEALCGVLLHTLNDPVSRTAARIDLTCFSSPYCDFHVRPTTSDSKRDEREMRFTCSRLALLCLLRSWPGLLHFCHPLNAGGLKALVAALYLPRLEVRKAILDLLYELVGLPQPEWTDEISVALDAVDPSDYQDSWRLNDGFVAAEGLAILPHLSATGSDITEIHLAVLLQCFLEAGLLDGLAEVIVTSDTFISVRATVLLGQILHLIHQYLPPQLCGITPALPLLMSQASMGKPQALAAVAALKRLHSMLEARPASNSLFLDHIIQYCSGAFKEKTEDTKSRKEKDNASMVKPNVLQKENSIEFLNDSDDEPKRHSVGSRADVANRNVSALVKSKSMSSRTSAAVSKVAKSAKFLGLFERESDNLIRCSSVMQSKDGNTWNWEIIRTILKENDNILLNLNDSTHKAWATSIINYLKPSANKYSHTDISSTSYGHTATRAGCQLIRHMLRQNDNDSIKLLEELFTDVNRQIAALETGQKAHECLFSPQHMCNTMCQMYFLFIGQLCHSQAGLKLFKETKLYDNLLELATKTHHSCYVKLIISSLDYTLDSFPREILSKILTCSLQASRLYATQFLNVLLRASKRSKDLVRRKARARKSYVHDTRKEGDGIHMDTWALQMLVRQVKDECKEVVKCALTILEEAFSVPAYQEDLITMRDTLCQNCRLDKSAEPSSLDISAVGDRGYLLWACLEVTAISQTGDIKATAFIKKHLEFWTKFYNYRYVRLTEGGIHSALSLCSGRSSPPRPARPPPHLYACLSAPRTHTRNLLTQHLHNHYKSIQRKTCVNEQEVADIKASLWALGHTASTSTGLQAIMGITNGYLEDSVLVHVIRLAQYHQVYSVRATAVYVLGLIGSTYDGANFLAELGWLSVRHTRNDQFPVILDESYPLYDATFTSPERRNTFDVEMSENSDITDLSMAESLLEYKKEADQDVVDHRREPDKRKSHTLPMQGSVDRPAMSESRTVDILRDCNYDRPGPHRAAAENRILISRMNSLEHAHEGRVRNTSESSTSGVSSCDSFLGKYAIPDRFLTLSPIPSSSSLYGMKGSTNSQRPRLPETQRRTSTSSFTPDVASSPPTQMDMSGYATLKSLNKHRRPHLSESAATGSSDIDDLSWLLMDTNKKSKPFSSLRDRAKSSRERMAKLSLLDYDWRPLPSAETGRHSPPLPRTTQRSQPLPRHDHPPSYIGITLPKNIMDLFPRDTESKDHTNVVENRRRIPSFMADSSNASTDNKSRATPDSQNLMSYRVSAAAAVAAGFGGKINMANSATSITLNSPASKSSNLATESSTKSETADKNKESTKKVIDSTIAEENIDAYVKCNNDNANVNSTVKSNNQHVGNKSKENDTNQTNHKIKETKTKFDDKDTKRESNKQDKCEKSIEVSKMEPDSNRIANETDISSAMNSTASINVNTNTNKKWRHSAMDCLACVPTRPPSSHELREAFFAGMDSLAEAHSPPPSPTQDTMPQAQIMHHVHCMSNPIHLKSTRSALLTLKQKHPEVFRSPCLYSDVCALLARDTYLLCARRFLQELFLDANFDCFTSEPAKILSRHPNACSPTLKTQSLFVS